MKTNLDQLKKQIIQVCKLMHLKGFTSATDSNVSVKLSDDKFLVTPSGINKAFIKESDLVIINAKGKVIGGNKKHRPSSEWRMHLKAYQLRKDINAVVHAHPPYITAYTIAGLEMPSAILPETVLTLGKIPVTEYSTPTSPDNARIIEKYIKVYDVVVLKRHGALTIGNDLYSAYNKLEELEYTALTGIAAKALGGCTPLLHDEVKRLLEMGNGLGILSQSCIKASKENL